MRITQKLSLSALVLSLAVLTGCAVRGTTRGSSGYTTGTVAARGNVTVGYPGAYYVETLPPDPVYEEISPKPYYGWVWVDGYWHWSGTQWTWVSGRWVPPRQEYVYVRPYYHHYEGRYVYVPGYWQHAQPSARPRDRHAHRRQPPSADGPLPARRGGNSEPRYGGHPRSPHGS